MNRKKSGRNKSYKASTHKNKRDRDYRKSPSIAPVTHDEDFLLGMVEQLEEPFILFLDRVQDPQNLGACLRTADAVL